MNYRNLGNSGILVSEIGLGTNNFGRKLNYKESEVIIKSSLDHGINLLDTADMYSNGLSEEYIGKATKENRDQYIIASKGGMNPMPSPTDTKVAQRVNEGPNKSGLSSVHIKRSVDESLKRLQTDYIDLYQTHIFDPFTRQEETLKALDDLLQALQSESVLLEDLQVQYLKANIYLEHCEELLKNVGQEVLELNPKDLEKVINK